jgi:hypothetical protein
MRWLYSNKDDIVSLECVNVKTNKYVLRLSLNSNFTNEEGEELQGDTRYISTYISNNPTVKDVRNILTDLQNEYDNSADVNSFYIDGYRVWLDAATRVKLSNLLSKEQSLGRTDTTLWFNKKKFDISVEKAISLLTAVEMYAKECYDNTQKHLLEISQLETVDDCLNYDITADYPTILKIETNG